MEFQLEKQQDLEREDLSKKGSLDEGIKPVVELINTLSNYYTTSSCAGRTVLLERSDNRKDHAKWLYADHDTADFDRIKKVLHSETDVWLKQESAILHVCCKTIENADNLCKLAKESGFKRAAILHITPRIIVEIFGTERVDVRVIRDGKILVHEDFLKEIINECNEKMERNKMRIDRLFKVLQKRSSEKIELTKKSV